MKEKYILTEYEVSANLPGKLTIGLVSDIHEHDMQKVLELLRRTQPDLIMVAGDTFERRDEDNSWRWREKTVSGRLLRLLQKLSDDLFELFLGKKEHKPENAYEFLRGAGKIAPVFLSLGNHEEYLLPEDLEVVRESGTTLLNNSECEIRVGNVPVRIGGLSSDADTEWLKAFGGKDGYRILLCHHPEYYDRYLRGLGLELVLSGHAHGGQIRLRARNLRAGTGIASQIHEGDV